MYSEYGRTGHLPRRRMLQVAGEMASAIAAGNT